MGALSAALHCFKHYGPPQFGCMLLPLWHGGTCPDSRPPALASHGLQKNSRSHSHTHAYICFPALQPEESSASEGEEEGSDFEQEVVRATKQRGAPGGGRQRKAAVVVSGRVRWEADVGCVGHSCVGNLVPWLAARGPLRMHAN